MNFVGHVLWRGDLFHDLVKGAFCGVFEEGNVKNLTASPPTHIRHNIFFLCPSTDRTKDPGSSSLGALQRWLTYVILPMVLAS